MFSSVDEFANALTATITENSPGLPLVPYDSRRCNQALPAGLGSTRSHNYDYNITRTKQTRNSPTKPHATPGVPAGVPTTLLRPEK